MIRLSECGHLRYSPGLEVSGPGDEPPYLMRGEGWYHNGLYLSWPKFCPECGADVSLKTARLVEEGDGDAGANES